MCVCLCKRKTEKEKVEGDEIMSPKEKVYLRKIERKSFEVVDTEVHSLQKNWPPDPCQMAEAELIRSSSC